MTTISLTLDDHLIASLEMLCAKAGRDKSVILADLVRRYVESEKLSDLLENPELVQLYQELAEEDVALAEQGMSEYLDLLKQADAS